MSFFINFGDTGGAFADNVKVGKIEDKPQMANENTLYITTDTNPSELLLYDLTEGWKSVSSNVLTYVEEDEIDLENAPAKSGDVGFTIDISEEEAIGYVYKNNEWVRFTYELTIDKIVDVLGYTPADSDLVDRLSNICNFTGSVNKFLNLVDILNPRENDMTIVIEDETRGGVSSIYIYNGADWAYAGEFKTEISVEWKDFV